MGLSRNTASQPEINDVGGDIGFGAVRGGFPFKRNPSHHRHRGSFDRQLPRSNSSSSISNNNSSGRSHLHKRKGLLLWLFPFPKSKFGFYAFIIAVVFLFALASMVLQSSITSVFRQRADRARYISGGIRFGSVLRFVPGRVSQRFLSGDGLDPVRSQPRIGVRAPRIALIMHLLCKSLSLSAIQTKKR